MRDALDGRRDVEGYVRSLTHETKAPLTAIRAAAELLQEEMPEADRRRFLTNIHDETVRLQQLVDRLLELSALEARRSLDPGATFDLGAVVRVAADSVRPVLEQKGVTLAVDADGVPPVAGDSLLVRQALLNLLHNAARWTAGGGAVAVRARTVDGHVDVTVEDSGPGVPDWALPRVFERFYSVPVPGAGKSSGLGLPFVREVALLHGGDARLENRAEGGARATLRLRVASRMV